MPGPPTIIADSLPTSKAPKLRSSCEGCGNAKVRCGRGQPKCGRCVALGLTCVYGISRKSGKPPRKMPSAYLDVPNSFSHMKRVTRRAKSCENHTSMGLEQSPNINKPARLSFTDPVTNILPLPSGLDLTGDIQCYDNRTAMGVRESQTANETAQPKISDPATTVPSHVNTTSSIYEQNQFDSSFITPLSLDDWPHFDIWGPGLENPPFSNDSRLPASALESVNNLSASFDSPESHSCPRGSYELFRDLICPSPFLHAPEANLDTVSARLDEVLHFNNDAIDRLRQLLKCPCAKSGHRIMVHASIISRILIWYQQAAGWTGSSSWESRPSALAASSPSGSASSTSPPLSWATADIDTASPPTLVQSTGFAVAQVPISMGTFNIEDENVQDAFRNQLVLSELKKAANVIDLFTSQHSGECSANGVASLYSHLGVWLRSEHLRTVEMLRARLSAFNKTLDS